VARNAPGTPSERVSEAMLTMKLIRILGILEGAGFAVEIVKDQPGTEEV
jgi:hypothetical protein